MGSVANYDNPLITAGEKEGLTLQEVLADKQYVKNLLKIPSRVLKNKNTKLIHNYLD